MPMTDLGSLTDIVAAFMALKLPFASLAAVDALPETERTFCSNHACSAYGIGKLQRWDVPCGVSSPTFGITTFCGVCGALFYGGRIIMSFDEGSSPHCSFPTAEGVTQARNRLAYWRLRLVLACEKMLEDRTMIDVGGAFAVAALVGKLNLLAPKLGLIGLVEEYAVRQVQQLLEEGAHAWQHPTPLRQDDLNRWRQKRALRRVLAPGDCASAEPVQPTDLTDDEWHVLKTVLPPIHLYGMSERARVNDILAVLSNGRSWRSLGIGAGSEALRYCNHWRTRGMWEALRLALRQPRVPFAAWATASGNISTLP